MILWGKVEKEGEHWLSSCDEVDALTQGETKTEAILMLGDWFKSHLGRKLQVDIDEISNHETPTLSKLRLKFNDKDCARIEKLFERVADHAASDPSEIDDEDQD